MSIKNPKTHVEKLKFLKMALKTPFHFFQFIPDKDLDLLVLESSDKDPHKIKRLSFSGPSIMLAIEEAYQYSLNEIKTGAIKRPFSSSKDEVEEVKVD